MLFVEHGQEEFLTRGRITIVINEKFGGDFVRVASENRLDALLAFTREEADISEPPPQPRSRGGCSDGIPPGVCGVYDGSGELGQLWAAYTVPLVDPMTAVVFWKANAVSEETELATWEDLRNSLTDKTVDQLLKDGVFSR